MIFTLHPDMVEVHHFFDRFPVRGWVVDSQQHILQNNSEFFLVKGPETTYFPIKLYLCRKSDNTVIGEIRDGLSGVLNTQGLAYRISKEYEGQGFMSALLKDYFALSSLKAFSVCILLSNESSIRLAQRNGFTEISRCSQIIKMIKYT